MDIEVKLNVVVSESYLRTYLSFNGSPMLPLSYHNI